MTQKRESLRKNNKAISPAISTVILTSAVVVLLVITVVFANNFLGARLAENEFSSMKQFMQTVGLQIDDVAWIIGRTQTIRYACRYGDVNLVENALNYTVYVYKGGQYVYLANYVVSILLFNMPVDKYSVANNFHERIFPLDSSFLQTGTAAPVSHVYVVEKLPMNDGSFIRVVVAPSTRMLNSTIFINGETKNYFKFYLPILSPGNNSRGLQSVTLTGSTVSAKMESDVSKIKITLNFPKWSLGFDNGFFYFESLEEEINVPQGSNVEFYTGEVTVSLG